MKKIVSVSFSEQSRAVVTDVKIVYEDENLNDNITDEEARQLNNFVLKETQDLFNAAQKFALNATFLRTK